MANNTELQNTTEALWNEINKNTELQQENFYLKTKIKQIEEILNQINNYGNGTR